MFGHELHPTGIIPVSGNIFIEPNLRGNFTNTDTGYITLSVKKKDTLLGQATYSLADILANSMAPISIQGLITDTIFLDYTASNYSLLSAVSDWTASVNGNIL